MARVRFLADHDLNEQIIDGVLRREPLVEVIRVRDLGRADRSDPEILELAARDQLILVSHDVNTMTRFAFERLARGLPMAGLLLARQSAPIAPVIDSLVLIWSASEAEEWHGAVWYLPI
jgi:hypothetical protein